MAKNLACTRAGRNLGRAERKRFFFEKKNQKTFFDFGPAAFGAVRLSKSPACGMRPMPAQRPETKIKESFLVLFSKKEPFSYSPTATLRKTARRWI
jgi:hypothetical protein